MEHGPRPPPIWMINWRNLVDKAMAWGRQAQRFLRTRMSLTMTTASAEPPTTGSRAPPCQHKYIQQSGNRHGSFARCLECKLLWKYDKENQGWVQHTGSSRSSPFPLPSSTTVLDNSWTTHGQVRRRRARRHLPSLRGARGTALWHPKRRPRATPGQRAGRHWRTSKQNLGDSWKHHKSQTRRRRRSWSAARTITTGKSSPVEWTTWEVFSGFGGWAAGLREAAASDQFVQDWHNMPAMPTSASVLGFWRPNRQPSHRNLSPHSFMALFHEGSLQDWARNGCSPPPSPSSSWIWISMDFHKFGTVFQNLSTMIPTFFQSLNFLRIPLVGIVDNWPSIARCGHMQVPEYLGRRSSRRWHALVNPALVLRSKPLWSSTLMAFPPWSMTLWERVESQGAQTSNKSNLLVTSLKAPTKAVSCWRALSENQSFWPLLKLQLSSWSQFDCRKGCPLWESCTVGSSELNHAGHLTSLSCPLMLSSSLTAWWSCP